MLTTGKLMLCGCCTSLACGLRAFLLLFVAVGLYVPNARASTETTKLISADGAAGDALGVSIAISGDTIVVGASREDIESTSAPGSGYVYVRSAGIWTQQAKLTVSNGENWDNFGMAVAISGDTIVIGAQNSMVGSNFSQGAAYVFVKPPGGWTDMTETAKLTAADGDLGDYFGTTVAVSGDTIVVGTPHEEFGPNSIQGTAYVFVKPGFGWMSMTHTAKLTASDGNAWDGFGGSVAIAGDTIVVGAGADRVGQNNAQGSAFVFVKPGSGWMDMTQTAKITAAGGGAGDLFGASVAIAGETIVAGAPNDNLGGSAYVFDRPVGGWGDMTQVAKLNAADGAYNDFFGRSVGVFGSTVVVGAPWADNGVNAEQGSAYVFVRPESGWVNLGERAKLTASDGAADDFLGYSVAVFGDTVVVGVNQGDIGANMEQGSANVYNIGLIESPLPAPPPHDRMKNRYVSFVPNNPNPGALGVALQVRGSSGAFPVNTDMGWVGTPDAQGISQVVTDPIFRTWPEPVIHVGDCEIIPVATYEIRGTMDGIAFTAPLTVSTIAEPVLNGKKWGDVAGINNGSEWTGPNLFTNVTDILAVLAYINGAAIKPEFVRVNLQAVSSNDPCLNAFVNTADVLILVKAVAGDAYPFTTNPATCPVCP